ncbi:MAG: hypothetical protein ACKVRN_02880 [Pyrinomonadaceae bacterium]
MVKQFRLWVVRLLPAFLVVFSAVGVFGQDNTPKPTPTKPDPTPKTKGILKPTTAEQVVETSILIYTGGRGALDPVRKTTLERGRLSVTTANGSVEQANYQRFVIRGETLAKERVRLDQELPTAKFSLVLSDERIFGIFSNTFFTPREDASRSFANRIFHGLDALLRYKPNESKLELALNEKLYGVDYFVVDVTDKQDRKTRFYVSAKTYRIMMLTYDQDGVRYRRKFYDYNYAQGVLVPFRTVLWANEKQLEETDIGTITFGQKVDEDMFKAG